MIISIGAENDLKSLISFPNKHAQQTRNIRKFPNMTYDIDEKPTAKYHI